MRRKLKKAERKTTLETIRNNQVSSQRVEDVLTEQMAVAIVERWQLESETARELPYSQLQHLHRIVVDELGRLRKA